MELTVYPADFNKLSNSPFCVKAIYLMNMSGQNWKIKHDGDPRKAPKAKLPVLKIGSQTIPDSEQIRDYLETQYNVDFDGGLTNEQKALSQAFIRMVEEHLYFAIVCDRWMDDKNWAAVRETYFSMIPKVMRSFISGRIRKQAIGQTIGQGMGRHSVEERFARVKHDIEAIEDYLGNKPFIHGTEPTSVDASVAAMLESAIETPEPTPMRDFIRGKPKLVAYVGRVYDALSQQK